MTQKPKALGACLRGEIVLTLVSRFGDNAQVLCIVPKRTATPVETDGYGNGTRSAK